jgi:hypothetical protein
MRFRVRGQDMREHEELGRLLWMTVEEHLGNVLTSSVIERGTR